MSVIYGTDNLYQIGSINFLVDPDSINVSISAIGSVKKSMGGTNYESHFVGNGLGYFKTMSISGQFMNIDDFNYIETLINSRTSVSITGRIAGIAGQYLVMGIQVSPTKPYQLFPGDDPNNANLGAQHNYTINFTQIEEAI